MENLFGRITQFSGGTGGDQSSPAENTRELWKVDGQ